MYIYRVSLFVYKINAWLLWNSLINILNCFRTANHTLSRSLQLRSSNKRWTNMYWDRASLSLFAQRLEEQQIIKYNILKLRFFAQAVCLQIIQYRVSFNCCDSSDKRWANHWCYDAQTTSMICSTLIWKIATVEENTILYDLQTDSLKILIKEFHNNHVLLL